MKSILKPILVPALSALAGGLIVFGTLKLNPHLITGNRHSNVRNQINETMFDDFFREADRFENLFPDKYKFGSENLTDVQTKEDEKAVYYEIKLGDLNSTSINTKVEDGYVTITGTTEKNNDHAEDQDENVFSRSVFKSTFQRSFPVPEHVDQNKMQVSSDAGKIILKFPKIKV